MEKLAQPKEIFQALYNHFLRLADSAAMHRSEQTAAGSPSDTSSLAAFVHGDPESNRVLCVRAMAAVYDHHAGAVGATAALFPTNYCPCWRGQPSDIL